MFYEELQPFVKQLSLLKVPYMHRVQDSHLNAGRRHTCKFSNGTVKHFHIMIKTIFMCVVVLFKVYQ